jgi:hypothetical protein
VGCSITVLCQLALERPGLETETSARRWSELSACCSVDKPRIFFNYWYTSLTPFVEGAGRVSKTVVVVTMFGLALGKVGEAYLHG